MSKQVSSKDLAMMVLSYTLTAPLFLTYENVPKECLEKHMQDMVDAFSICGLHNEPINAANVLKNMDGKRPEGAIVVIAHELDQIAALKAQEHDALDALKQLRELNKIAKFKDGMIKTLQECDTGLELDVLIANAEERITKSADTIAVNTQVSLFEAAEQSMDEFYNPKKNWVTTGFKAIDDDIGGVFPGEMVVLSGISGSGKSQFGLQVAQNITNPDLSDDSIFYFSMEMKPNNLFNRLMCSEFKWDIHQFRMGIKPDHVDLNQVKRFMEYLKKHRFYIDGMSNVSLPLLHSSYNRMVRKYGKPKAVFIDHILLMDHQLKDDFSGTAKLSRGLTAFSRDEELPLFALTQLNKETLKRADGKPTVNDLKNSTQLFNDAAHIWFTHNPFHVDNRNIEYKNINMVLQRKSRYGESGRDWELGWYYGKFTNNVPSKLERQMATRKPKQAIEQDSAYEYEDPAAIFG